MKYFKNISLNVVTKVITADEISKIPMMSWKVKVAQLMKGEKSSCKQDRRILNKKLDAKASKHN